METTRLCPQCQQPLAADAPSGLCPQCLLKAAAGPPPSASGVSLAADDFIDIGDPAEVARKLPQFEILEMLGRGGMGVVYKARQRNLDRIVALKILPPGDATSADFVARFTREARALAKLNHPNIVNVHDFGVTSSLYYIIMEFVDGMNLRQLLQTRRLTPAEALAIVPKICDALEYAHEEGLVHRDIKPENLLIDKKGRMKIADFGLAKLLRREPLDMTLTLSGMALGTLRYMAPEQMDKPETVDHRADLYSLGVVIYEMLTGETPVGRFQLPSRLANVDVRLDDIVVHALEKEPDRRYQHASEVKSDVENVTSRPAPVATRDPAPTRPADEDTGAMLSGARRPSRVAIILGVAAVLLLACSGYAVYDHLSTREAMVRRLTPLADATGTLSMPALIFEGLDMGGETLAEETLAALQAEPAVVAACVYTKEGKAFAKYVREGVQDFPLQPGADGVQFLANDLVLFRPIVDRGERVGTIYIKASLENRLWLYVRICVLVVGGFLLVTAPKLVSDLRARRADSKEETAPDLPNAPHVSGPANEIKPGAENALRKPDVEVAAPTPVPQGANDVENAGQVRSEPGLSRLALCGAIWAPFAVTVGLPEAVFIEPKQLPHHGVLADLVGQRPAWFIALNFLLLLIGGSAPFGTTILGVIAIGKIKRSAGKTYGLGLAAADALLFPALALFCVSALIVNTILASLSLVDLRSGNPFGVLIAAVICFFTTRKAWRAILGKPATSNSTEMEKTISHRFLGLPTWMWPVIAALLIIAAIYVPRPADLTEPKEARDIFQPTTLVTPEGGSYRFVAFEEWQKFKPVYAVTVMIGTNQNITRTLSWDANGVSLGFFHRKARWSYQLTATRFNWKSPADGPVEIAPEEKAKLRPLVVAELNKREIGRGARLEQMLDHGVQIDSLTCWQNLVVLLAWLSLLATLAALVWMVCRAIKRRIAGVTH